MEPDPAILDEGGSEDQGLQRNDDTDDGEDELARRGAVEDDRKCDKDEL
jgi:hypothetical protein